MTPLEEVLTGREERAAWQSLWLNKKREQPAAAYRVSREPSSYFVVQIALNIPGYPKRVPHDLQVIKNCRKYLLRFARAVPEEEHYLENGAGVCWQGAFDADRYDAEHVKRVAIDTEKTTRAGRVLDIDVITNEGPISRTWMDLPPRQCFVCGREAKICAKEGCHDQNELREMVTRIIADAVFYR